MSEDFGSSIHAALSGLRTTIHDTMLPVAAQMESDLDHETQALEATLHQVLEDVRKTREQLHRGFQTAHSTLRDSATHFLASANQLNTQLQQVDEHVTSLKQQVDTFATQSHQEYEVLIGQLEHLDADAQQQSDLLKSQLQGLSHQMQESLQMLQTEEHQYEQEVNGFQQEVVQQLTNLDHQMTGFEHQTNQHLGEVQQLAVSNLAQMNSQHSQDFSAISQQRGSQVQQVFHDWQSLVQGAHSVGANFDGDSQKVLHTLEQISHLLQQIKPVLNVVKELIG